MTAPLPPPGDPPPQDRREFFRTLARWTALTALVGGATGLVARTLGNPEACDNPAPCLKCRKQPTCRFPRALADRKSRRLPADG